LKISFSNFFFRDDEQPMNFLCSEVAREADASIGTIYDTGKWT
jgi:hypothetical protein